MVAPCFCCSFVLFQVDRTCYAGRSLFTPYENWHELLEDFLYVCTSSNRKPLTREPQENASLKIVGLCLLTVPTDRCEALNETRFPSQFCIVQHTFIPRPWFHLWVPQVLHAVVAGARNLVLVFASLYSRVVGTTKTVSILRFNVRHLPAFVLSTHPARSLRFFSIACSYLDVVLQSSNYDA